jgi:hypothetical protein
LGSSACALTTSEITSDKLTHTRLVDPLEAAARYLPRLKQEGATASRNYRATPVSFHRFPA